jgi:DeoR family transcriptional regulator, catabolite repression regulator
MTSIEKSVEQIMLSNGAFPILAPNSLVKEAMDEMNQHGIGIACIVGSDSTLLGIITDGDLRRRLIKTQKPFSAIFNEDVINFSVEDVTSINITTNIREAAQIFLEKKVWDLPIVDDSNKLLGIVHLHDIVESLIS